MTDQLPSKERDLLAELRALPGGYRLLGYTAAEEIERLKGTLEVVHGSHKWLFSEKNRLEAALTGISTCSACEACRGAAKRALGSSHLRDAGSHPDELGIGTHPSPSEIDKRGARDCCHPVLIDDPQQPGVNVYLCARCDATVRLNEFEVRRAAQPPGDGHAG